MGRAISFDLDRALDAAMRQFWKGGYAATSLQDLLAATGVGAGSFYNTLKSKKALYLTCLQRYGETEVRRRAEVLAAAPSVGAGIRALFRVSFDALDDPDTPSRMCMMSAMLAPEVLSDPDLRRVVEDGRDRFRTLLAELIARDRELGHLPATTDAETTASVIATYGEGLNRVALVAYDRARLERETDVFLRGLGL